MIFCLMSENWFFQLTDRHRKSSETADKIRADRRFKYEAQCLKMLWL